VEKNLRHQRPAEKMHNNCCTAIFIMQYKNRLNSAVPMGALAGCIVFIAHRPRIGGRPAGFKIWRRSAELEFYLIIPVK
jgi:hypothetical protein